MLDPYKNKKDIVNDFNRDPSQAKLNKGKIQFVDQGSSKSKPGLGDEFFYKIQKTVNRNENIQKELDKGTVNSALSSKIQDKVQNLTSSGYVDMESDSNSDMEGVQETKANMESIASIKRRPDQNVFEDIFN